MKNKGITLVALVVTIIILLILAGVTLNIALGDNGLFKMARNAANIYTEKSKGEGDILKQIENQLGNLSNGGTITDNPKEEPPTPKDILNVKLKLDEANVKSDRATVQVEEVKNSLTNELVTSGLTYTYSLLNEPQEEVTDLNNSHEFTNLDKTKSYTINVKATDKNNNYGEASIKVISFVIKEETFYNTEKYYRCEEGITWEHFVNSEGYNPTLYLNTDKPGNPPFWDFKQRGEYVNLLSQLPDWDSGWNGPYYDYYLRYKNGNDVLISETIKEGTLYDYYRD